MLLDAVTRGRIYQVKFLLESGTEDVNKTDENKQTALTKAIFLPDKMHRTRYKIVKILLEHGARVNTADREGRTALMWACIRGQENVVRKILDVSILDLDLNGGDQYGNTALFYAASSGQVNTVKRLVTALKRFGLDIDKKNAHGMTPILEATKQGHDLCAQVLMTEGKASLTIRDPETFLNTKEWAEKRSLTNLSELIAARRSPSPQIAVQNVENEPELDGQSPRPATDSANLKDTKNNLAQESNAHDMVPSPRQRRNSLVENKSKVTSESPHNHDAMPQTDKKEGEHKKEGPVCHRSNTTTVSLTRRKSEQMEKLKGGPPLTAKSEMCRLLSLYGIQHSESYRQSFDPILLPPSGYWPDPLAHLRDNASSIADEDIEMNFLDLIRPRGSGRRKSSAFPGAPEMGRRGSNVNFRDGRRGSTMLSGLPPGMAKRTSVTPSAMMGGKNFLEAPGFSSRRSTLTANAERKNSPLGAMDRRASLMPRGAEQARPTLPRRTTTHIASGLGHIIETA